MLDFTLNSPRRRKLKAGDILLAEPFLDDDHFTRSVVLVCEHAKEGTFGLIINKLSDVPVADAADGLYCENGLFIGGPVDQDTLHYVHTIKTLRNAIKLKEGMYWGGDFEHLKEFSLKGKVHETNCRFFLGYSGWEDGQLEKEIKEEFWIVAKISLKEALRFPPETMWKDILNKMGGKYKMFANYPLDPRMN